MRKLAAMLLALMMITGNALAEIKWPRLTTPGQEQLQSYIARVNENLQSQGMGTVNSIFELYTTFVTMGITGMDNADVPEDVELTFQLSEEGVISLQLRVSDPGKFAAMAAACVQASSPGAITMDEALAEVNAYLQRTLEAPFTIFEDAVDMIQGLSPRLYYAYFPNQYSDKVDWRQITLIFPLPGSEDAPLAAAPEQEEARDIDNNELFNMNTNTYEEGYEHLEVFVTPTPEPDSAANGFW